MSYLDVKEDAEDASQEIWLKVYLNLSKFNYNSSFSTWLYRITVNTCVDKLKVKKKVHFQSIVEYSVYSDGSKLDDEENIIDVTNSLKTLSKEESVLLKMKYIEGYTYSEIAEILKLKESAIKMRIKRVKDKLTTKNS